MSRWIDLDGTANTRDVGGLPLEGGGVTAAGVLLRSDNLQELTAGDVAALAGLPVSDVVDLRTRSEREGTGPGPLGSEARHHFLSLIPEERLADPAMVLPDRWSDGATGAYLHYLADRPEAVAAAVRVVATAPGATIVHCAAGKDRTGVVTAVILEAVGVERSATVGDYAETNARIGRIYDRLLRSETYAADVARIGLDAHRVDPYTMRSVLDVMDERWNGAAAYLSKAGLSDAELNALRSRLAPQPVR